MTTIWTPHPPKGPRREEHSHRSVSAKHCCLLLYLLGEEFGSVIHATLLPVDVYSN